MLVDIVDIPPLPISMAVNGDAPTLDDSCTRQGYLPLTLSDGSTHWQLCFYCKNLVETIISPQAILTSSEVFASWMQTGFKDGRPGQIRFDSHNGLVMMKMAVEYRDGLYYCPTEVLTVDWSPVSCNPTRAAYRLAMPPTPTIDRRPSRFSPTSKSKQLNPKYGSSNLAPLAYTSLMYFWVMSLVYPPCLNTIRSGTLILRSKPGPINRLPNVWLCAQQTTSTVIT